MKTAHWLALPALLLCTAVIPQTSRAQVISDIFFETILGNGAVVDSPLFFAIFEAPGGEDVTFTVPALTVDFLEPGGQEISDRFHFDDYTLHMTSADEPGSLAPRPGAIVIDKNHLERFTVWGAAMASDDDLGGPISDLFELHLGGGISTGVFIFPEIGPDPGFEGVTFATVGTIMFDVYDRSGVSDYVDLSNLTGFFISADDQAVYQDPQFNFVVNGTFEEFREGPSTLFYDMHFASVPEPGAYGSLLSGLAVLGGLAWRRRARK